ncbi:hypothetical protein GCM10022254_38260 [Actinomadura meridiana]|uniref:Uncharacterized protein n=2 Tax=Actinomadura meridiana TaxID=559626 RepID=A0ABP8C6G8_9ACTN
MLIHIETGGASPAGFAWLLESKVLVLGLRSKIAGLAAVAGTAGLVLTACGGKTDPPPKGDSQSGMTLERRQLIIAENELTSICMRKHGFKHVTAIPPVREAPDPAAVEGDNIASRKANGYGLSSRGQGNGLDGVGVNGRYLDSLSKAEQARWQRTYIGDDTKKINVTMPDGSTVSTGSDGCVTEARRTLYGDISKYLRVYMVAVNYTGEAYRLTIGDPAYTAAVGRWKQCMTGRGYHFDSPKAAYEATDEEYEKAEDKAKARRQEIAVAMADAECNRQVGLSKLQHEIQQKNEEAMAKKYQADILAYRELEKTALAHAKKLVNPKLLGS